MVLKKAEVERELIDTVKAGKLAYGHTVRNQGSCVEKEIMQGTMPGARRRGRPRTACMDNIKSWTGLFVEESIRMTEDRDKWRKYVHGAAKPRRTAEEQNRYSLCRSTVMSVSVCVCECVCLSAIISSELHVPSTRFIMPALQQLVLCFLQCFYGAVDGADLRSGHLCSGRRGPCHMVLGVP